jgi:cell division inhibitor SepF
MASSLRKMANFLGLMDDENVESIPQMEERVEVETSRPVSHRLERNETPSYMRGASRLSSVSTPSEPVASVRPIHSGEASYSTPSASYSSANVSRDRAISALDIVPLNPRLYSDAKSVGEHYRNGQTVIMNLTDMEDEERRRIVDFAAGLVFGHDGKIERITSKVFLLTPPNVTVSGDEKRAAAETHFFNQS